MSDSNSDTTKKKVPTWFIMVLILSTLVFIGFMIFNGRNAFNRTRIVHK